MPSNALSRIPTREAMLDLIAQARAAGPDDPMSDEEYFLAQLRAAIRGGESPVDRLRSRYGAARPDQLSRLYARYLD